MKNGTFIPLTSSEYGVIFWGLFSHNGKLIFFGGDSPNIWLWNIEKSALEGLITTDSDVIFSAAYHPILEQLAVSHTDRSIQIWDVTTREKIVAFPRHHQYATNLVYINKGKQLVSADHRSVGLSDAMTGKKIGRLKRFRSDILELSAAENGSYFGVTHRLGVEVWNEKLETIFRVEGHYYHGGKLQSGIVITRDGHRVWVSFRTNPGLCLWNLESIESKQQEQVKLRDLFPEDTYRDYYEQKYILNPVKFFEFGDVVYVLAISYNEKLIAVGLREEIVLLSSETLEVIQRWKVPLGNEPLRTSSIGPLSFSPDSHYLISICQSSYASAGGIWIWPIMQ